MANNYTNSIDSEIQDSSEIDSQLTNVVVVEENAPIKSISVNGVPSSIVNENVDISVPEKTSDIQNDGNGTSPFATEQFVSENGGKIDSISVNGVEQPIDENKNVDIELPENIAETDKNNNFSTSQTINGTLTVNGDIVQNGESYETHAEKVYTKNDTIILREGAVGGLGNDEYAGFEAEKYDGENTGVLGFGADGVARVGDKGNEQPLLTREESEDLSNGDVLVWNSETNRAEGSSDYVKFTDYASQDKAGVHKVSPTYGTRMVGEILDLMPAQYSEIDKRTSNEYPLYLVTDTTRRQIVPANVDYAVKKTFTDNKLVGTAQEWTDAEKTSARNLLGAVGSNEYATNKKAGVVKVQEMYGIRLTSQILDLAPATNTIIDQRASSESPRGNVGNNTRAVLVPANIDYAVKKSLTDNKLEDGDYAWTDEEKDKVLEFLGAVKQTTGSREIFGTDWQGKPATYRVDYPNDATVNGIPVRAANGAIQINDESCEDGGSGSVLDGLQAVNKNYVKKLIAEKSFPELTATQLEDGSYSLSITTPTEA